jgi:hypothetical protein
MSAVITAIDANALPGILEIGSVGMAAVLATFTLNKPSFVESGGIITMAGVPKVAPGLSIDSAASARIKDGGGIVVVSNLTVGIATSGADIILATISITTGTPVIISSGTITHAA